MKDETEERVLALARRKTGSREVSLDSRLLHDLGIDGDDAEELIVDVCEAFEIDMRKIELTRYFGGELGIPFHCLVRACREAHHRKKEPLTVGQLVTAARLKQWIY